MSDNANNPFRCGNGECENEPVCIDVLRVYDSCSSKDCLEDLCVYFSPANQELIDAATSVRLRNTEIINVYVDIETLPFRRGYYSVNITFYFNVWLEVSTVPPATTLVNGLSIFTKQVVMYASEGNIKVYTSDTSDSETINVPITNLPKANVQTADPISLGAKLLCNEPICVPCQYIPESVSEIFGGTFATEGTRRVLVSIGLFSIVQTVRNVQMLVPAYDYCVPCKECHSSADNPCDVFSRIEFPTNEFFPDDAKRYRCDSDCGK